MRALVTGGGGFIGSHLVEKLHKEGHWVIGIDRKLLCDWSIGERVCDECFPIDILDQGKIFDLDLRFDVCFHLAADARIQPSFQNPVGYVQDNVLGTARMLELSRKAGAYSFVYAGSSTADDDVSKNVYATTKIAGEQLCRAWHRCFGLQTSVARFYNVYGERQVEEGQYATVIGIWEKQFREGKPLTVTGTGTQRRDFTAVEDIVDGLYSIAITDHSLKCPTFNLGTGTNDCLLGLAQLFGSPIEFLPRPPGEAEQTLADIEYSRMVLDWKPRRSIHEYIVNLVNKKNQETAN